MTKLIKITGKALTGEWGSEAEGCDGIPVLRTTNFTNGGEVNYKNVVYRKIKKKNIQNKFLIHGDIIIEKSGGSDKQPVGRVIFFEGEENKYIFNNFTGLLRIKNQKFWYPKYVFYSLYFNYLNGGTRPYENKTTGLHNLKIDSFLNECEIIPVSYIKQKEICDKLDSLKRIVAIKENQLLYMDDLIKSRFVEMFGNPEINNQSMPTISMKNVCEVIDGDRGKQYPKQNELTENGYCLFLNAKNVTSNGFCFSDCVFVSKQKDELLRTGHLERGDIVLTTRGTIGNLAYYDNNIPYDNMRINSGMVILRMNHDIISERYFIEQFKMMLPTIKQKIASGSAQPQLPISTMGKINLLLPTLELQYRYSDYVVQIDKSKIAVQKSLDETQKLFDSLMQQYFG